MSNTFELFTQREKIRPIIDRAAETILPSCHGDFRAIAYRSDLDEQEHLALTMGNIAPNSSVLVRIHSECLTGDVFASYRCDCGEQLKKALAMIGQAGTGVILYLRQEGRGIGLANKLKAYALQDKGRDTVQANEDLGFNADLRDYGIGAQILMDLGVRKVKLMTNNPKKLQGLEEQGLEVTKRIPLFVSPREENQKYMKTKSQKMNHLLDL